MRVKRQKGKLGGIQESKHTERGKKNGWGEEVDEAGMEGGKRKG